MVGKIVTLLMSNEDAAELEFNDEHGNSIHFGGLAEEWKFTLLKIEDEPKESSDGP